jgi:DNA-binding MarR family transcriptional regulator
MHFVAFAFKRAHRASLALVRPWLGRSPITPARYDILHAIHRSQGYGHQAELCRTLGLSNATISRAVKRLEELGIVRRERASFDRRLKAVRFTAEGLREFRRIMYELVVPAYLPLEYLLAIGGRGFEALERLDDMYWALLRLARFFGDTSDLFYPTGHPDD